MPSHSPYYPQSHLALAAQASLIGQLSQMSAAETILLARTAQSAQDARLNALAYYASTPPPLQQQYMWSYYDVTQPPPKRGRWDEQ